MDHLPTALCQVHNALSREAVICIICILDGKSKETEDEQNDWKHRWETVEQLYRNEMRMHDELRAQYELPPSDDNCKQS